MKKSGRKIELGWRLWSLIICALILIGVAGFSYATNSGNPAIMGHTANEIEGGIGVPSSLSCRTVTNTSHVSFGTAWRSNASCNSDEFVTGGGVTCGSFSYGDSPSGNNGWYGMCESGGSFAVHSICCKLS